MTVLLKVGERRQKGNEDCKVFSSTPVEYKDLIIDDYLQSNSDATVWKFCQLFEVYIRSQMFWKCS